MQKTTAGTVGAVAARHAERLYCASFLVAAATAAAIRRSDARDVYFVVTGEGGAGDEDRACAEYIAALIENPAADVEPYLERVDASNAARIMRQRVADGVPGVDAGDILACMDANRFHFVMRARDEGRLLVLRAYNQGDA